LSLAYRWIQHSAKACPSANYENLKVFDDYVARAAKSWRL
jgi:hypothetical protein